MDDIRETIRKRYADIARQADSCCCEDENAEASGGLAGYDAGDLEAAPADANMGLGCGNPTAIADLKHGETVFDLGSGGGFDCFLAANAVGENGRVIGVDMTEEMIATARENAADADYDNVEFRTGEIEKLPVEDAMIDVVISNCVINLVPDKQRAFAEVARVLKPRGRSHVSDIVLEGELPAELLDDEDAYVGCVSGAVTKEKYLDAMQAGGLDEIKIEQEKDATQLLEGCCETDDDEDCGCSVPPELPEGLVRSVTVSARKPC